jgi:16S rRNA (guanine527-N7)-methyltransferase
VQNCGFYRRLSELLTNSPHNLVSSRSDPEEVCRHHLGDAQRLGEILGPFGGRWMDLGTGGGLPGLVLARMWEEAEWVLVDAKRKKAREVERFAGELGVDCRVVVGRAEDLAREQGWREGFDGVVTRAVAPLRIVVELARGFLAHEGRLIAVKGSRAEEEIEVAGHALERTGMELVTVTELGGQSRGVVLRAAGPVPEGIPRRAGVPQKRPL